MEGTPYSVLSKHTWILGTEEGQQISTYRCLPVVDQNWPSYVHVYHAVSHYVSLLPWIEVLILVHTRPLNRKDDRQN